MKKYIVQIICVIQLCLMGVLISLHYYKKYNECQSKEVICPETELSAVHLSILGLCMHESHYNPTRDGKTNDLGILQLTPIYVAECNRIIGEERYSLADRSVIQKSLEMFYIYQNKYNPNWDLDKMIELHNPRAGESYKKSVKLWIEFEVRREEIKKHLILCDF